MIERFPPNASSIRLPVLVRGPNKDSYLFMFLDTGASRTMLTWEAAVNCGYDPAAGGRFQVVTASGFEMCSEITLSEFVALGRCLHDFPTICHPLPTALRGDGLLGLDFFRATRLTIDFRVGEVALEV
jgi:aspartyl protease family protein